MVQNCVNYFTDHLVTNNVGESVIINIAGDNDKDINDATSASYDCTPLTVRIEDNKWSEGGQH